MGSLAYRADSAVHEISGVVPKTVIEMLLASLGIDPKEGAAPHLAKGFQGVKDAVKQVGREGWSAGQVLEQVSTSYSNSDKKLHDAIILQPGIHSIAKSLAALAMAECDKALCEGGDEELQLLECCLRVKAAMERPVPS